MKKINEVTGKIYGNYPEKIIQFGEGNFLRAFADWMIDLANESGKYKGSVVLCQPIPRDAAMADKINGQNGVYTLITRGMENNAPVEKFRKITSVSRCINSVRDYREVIKLAGSKDLEVVISNTTEAGIVYKEGDKLTDAPPSSFPAKITVFLYERYKAFNGAEDKGLLFLPVELIDYNGTNLKKIVLRYAAEWKLEPAFINWVEKANKFTNTLVDRIVTGYPKDQVEYFEKKLGYKDEIMVAGEVFNLWVIEGKKEWAEILPVGGAGANVIWTDDVTPYKTRKVRILNGAHTATVPAAYLSGHAIVLDFMNDPVFQKYLKQILFKEIIPALDLPKEELEAFANDVLSRFANPYIKHNLLDIALNCGSKFNARCLPSLLEYAERKKELPELLTFSLAAFIKFYRCKPENGGYAGVRKDGTKYIVRDDAETTAFFADAWKTDDPAAAAKQVLSNKKLWGGRDLTEVKGLENKVAGYLIQLQTKDVKDVIAGALK